MVQRYRKQPVVIEAVQFTGENHDEIVRFAGLKASVCGRKRTLMIKTLEGALAASPGDYIIKGIRGEFYPCKPDVFRQTYEAVEE